MIQRATEPKSRQHGNSERQKQRKAPGYGAEIQAAGNEREAKATGSNGLRCRHRGMKPPVINTKRGPKRESKKQQEAMGYGADIAA